MRSATRVNIKIDPLLAAAKEAGAAIMQHLTVALEEEFKKDAQGSVSRVTKADRAANEIIKLRLQEIAPGIPILSEEDTLEQREKANASPLKWVVDPLDGTNTAWRYAQGDHQCNQFGVHIALVENGVPVLGVVFCPAMENGKGVAYFTGHGGGKAYKQIGDEMPRAIHVSKPPLRRDLRAAVHAKPERRPEKMAGNTYVPVPGVGGQRLCLVAEGAADLVDMDDIPLEKRDTHAYKQWDLAAANAILNAAGGALIDAQTKLPVMYNSADFTMPGTIGGGRGILAALRIAELQPALLR